MSAAVSCASCEQPLGDEHDFCEACGTRVSDQQKEALRERADEAHLTYVSHRRRSRSARTTIGALAILFVIGGVVYFFVTREQLHEEFASLGGDIDPEEPRSLALEPWRALGLNLFMACVMFVLWLWAKRSILPAIITALGIYVTMIVASWLYDPSSITQGILMKIIIVVALVRGVRSTLAVRKHELSS